MKEKYDLARMRRELREDAEALPGQTRILTQNDIKRLVADRKRRAAQPEPPAAPGVAR